MDDEDDYMGDISRFLPPDHQLPCKSSHPPAQQISSISKEKLNWQDKRKLKRELQQNVEDQHRSEGLNLAISSSNIGFKMMQQMGYSAGAALGKHGQGSLEPITVDVKRSRTGLGRDRQEKMEKDRKVKQAERRLERKQRKVEELKVEFQQKRRSSWQSRKLASDYRKACAALSQLEEKSSKASGNVANDTEVGSLEENTASAELEELGDEHTGEDVAEEDDSDEEVTQEDLQELLRRLRMEYFYCFYCGCQYDTADSLLANCPGLEEDDH